MTQPDGWYLASDGNWYHGADPRPFPAPPPPSGGSGALHWAARHKVVTGLGVLFAMGLVGSAAAQDRKPAPAAAPVESVSPAATTPAAVRAVAPPARATTAPPPPAATVRATRKPAPKPAPKPKPTAAAPVQPVPAVASDDPRFRTCREAIAHGYGPYYQGQDPEYYWYRDADHDGVDCER